MNFKAVIFDMGGVLKSYSGVPLMELIFNTAKDNPKFMKGVVELEKGVTWIGQKDTPIYKTLTTLPNFAKYKRFLEFSDRNLAEYMPDDHYITPTVTKIKAAGLQTALLTNNFFVNEQKTQSVVIPNAEHMFDLVVESCKVGSRKPEKAIYLMVADKLGVRPEQCIMVDDLGENCDGARAVGMTAVHVQLNNTKEAVVELEKLLQLKLINN